MGPPVCGTYYSSETGALLAEEVIRCGAIGVTRCISAVTLAVRDLTLGLILPVFSSMTPTVLLIEAVRRDVAGPDQARTVLLATVPRFAWQLFGKPGGL